ncbi:MAG: hypothetical protein JXR71_09815 [Bacteroidales bacterium]|nr:hypothetical protein [Bacteroidales bacterium]
MQNHSNVKQIVNRVTLSFFFFIPALLFGQADGLKPTHCHNVIRDRQGNNWISIGNGIRIDVKDDSLLPDLKLLIRIKRKYQT